MKKILNFMHDFFMWTFSWITLIFIDLPLKVIGCILILIIGLICAIFYPLVRRIEYPTWLENFYVYSTTNKKLISRYVYRLWR